MLNLYLILWSVLIFNSLEKENEVMIIAHRGSSFLAPENTLAAVDLAWQQQTDAVEIDVHLSKDNRLMVIHDHDTKRTAGKNYEVSETASNELRKLEVGSFKDAKYKGEPIPYLEEVLATVPAGKSLFIEIKCGAEAVPVLKKLLAQENPKGEMVVISFNYEVIDAMGKQLPDVPAYWLLGRLEGMSWNEVIDKVNVAGAAGVNLHHGLVNNESMQKLNEAGFPVYCWTVDDEAVALKMDRLGVKGITTNKPDKMLKLFK